MKNSKYEFNKLFYKTGNFWVGCLLLFGLVGNFFLNYHTKWDFITGLVMIIMFFNAFLKKKPE